MAADSHRDCSLDGLRMVYRAHPLRGVVGYLCLTLQDAPSHTSAYAVGRARTRGRSSTHKGSVQRDVWTVVLAWSGLCPTTPGRDVSQRGLRRAGEGQ